MSGSNPPKVFVREATIYTVRAPRMRTEIDIKTALRFRPSRNMRYIAR